MPLRNRYRVLAAVLLALPGGCAAPPAPGSAACVPRPLARLDIEFRAGVPSVALDVDGQRVVMVLDLGAEVTVVSEAAADRLHLARDPTALPTLNGVGGSMVRWAAEADDIKLGGIDLRHRRMEVAPFGSDRIDGALGLDVLLDYDIDWDLAHRRVTLNAASGCSGPPVGWPSPAVEVPLDHPAMFEGEGGRSKLLLLAASVDGRPMTALLDSGASISLITPQAAAQLEAPAQDAERVRLSGLGPDRMAGAIHRFRSLTVAGDTVSGWNMAVAPVPSWAGSMILGVPFLVARPAWLPAGGARVWFGPPASLAASVQRAAKQHG